MAENNSASVLTDKDQQILSSLVNPDAEKPVRYQWDEDFQRQILSLLLHDRYFLVQSMGLINPYYFTNEVHQSAAKLLYAHFEKYSTIPNKIQLTQEIKNFVAERKPETQIYFLSELNTVYDYYCPGVESREYFSDKIANFAKYEAIKKAFKSSIEIIKTEPEKPESYLRAWELVKEAMTVERNFEVGLDYFESYEERYARMREDIEKGEIFTTGFASIDAALVGGGLSKGEMGSWMGLSGTGKSLALVASAIANMNRGKRVLYVSLEMNQDKVAERFDAQLGDPNNEHDVTINNLYDKKDVIFQALHDYVSDKEDRRLMVVKQFPAGTMDIAMFRAYYSQLTLYGFRPDLVIVDYVGEMKDFPNMPTHESRYRIVRDLRGFAVEEQVCVLTAMQPNRGAKEVVKMGDVIDDDNLSDSYSQVKPLDALWSINQFMDEKECGLGRIYVCKHRHGKSKFIIYVEYNPKTLKISEISKAKYEERLKLYQNLKEERSTDAVSTQKKKYQQEKFKSAAIENLLNSEV